MPTRIALDDKLLQEALKLGGQSTIKEAVNEALREYIQRRKRLAAVDAFGTFDFDEDYDFKAERLKR